MQLGILFDKTVGEWATTQAGIITRTASPLSSRAQVHVRLLGTNHQSGPSPVNSSDHNKRSNQQLIPRGPVILIKLALKEYLHVIPHLIGTEYGHCLFNKQ